MEFFPSLISRLDPTTNSGFILTLLLFAGVAISSWPKVRIRMEEAKDKIEESENARHVRKMNSVQADADYYRRNMEDLLEETRLLHDYAQYAMRAMRRVESFLTSSDIDFPPPPFEDYDTWVKRTKADEEDL